MDADGYYEMMKRDTEKFFEWHKKSKKMNKRDFASIVKKGSWIDRDEILIVLKKTNLVLNHLLRYTYEQLKILIDNKQKERWKINIKFIQKIQKRIRI